MSYKPVFYYLFVVMQIFAFALTAYAKIPLCDSRNGRRSHRRGDTQGVGDNHHRRRTHRHQRNLGFLRALSGAQSRTRNLYCDRERAGLCHLQVRSIPLAAGQSKQVDVKLQIEVEQQQVQVNEESTTVDTSPENNANAIIIKGKDLEALSDDPDELQSELQALAGPAAGPNGGEIYIDGFTGGQIPPKSSIREIRINQNPFSAEFDRLGYGRIEIFTKPGTDKLHGQIESRGNDSAFNSQNPILNANLKPGEARLQEPSYYSYNFNGSVGGPLNKIAALTS